MYLQVRAVSARVTRCLSTEQILIVRVQRRSRKERLDIIFDSKTCAFSRSKHAKRSHH